MECEGPGGEARPRPPSDRVCQLPREESGDGQAGQLRNRGWEIQQEGPRPCVNRPEEAGLWAAGQTAERALSLQPFPLGHQQ